jgi:hypothetical protein
MRKSRGFGTVRRCSTKTLIRGLKRLLNMILSFMVILCQILRFQPRSLCMKQIFLLCRNPNGALCSLSDRASELIDQSTRIEEDQ